MIKNTFYLCMIVLISSSFIPSVSGGADIPAITSPVNDYAGVINPDLESRISNMILAHRKKTGVQMAVLTVRTTGGMNIEDYSLRAAMQWGGGAKERDDGLLFTVAVSDRRMRIEVGYGLEGYVTDLRAGRILDGIRGDFRKYDYGVGIEKAVKEIIRATDSYRPGQPAPVAPRVWNAIARIANYYSLFFIFGALAAVSLILGSMRYKFSVKMNILASLILFIALPVLFQLLLNGVWGWIPFVYLTGAFAGAAVFVALKVPKTKTGKIVATVFAAIPALASLISIFYLLQVNKPVEGATTDHETALLGILIGTSMLQFFILGGTAGATEEGGGSYSSGSSYGDSSSSYSSDSSSSSSGSDSSSYSGGGGSYGGGGASSSW